MKILIRIKFKNNITRKLERKKPIEIPKKMKRILSKNKWQKKQKDRIVQLWVLKWSDKEKK